MRLSSFLKDFECVFGSLVENVNCILFVHKRDPRLWPVSEFSCRASTAQRECWAIESPWPLGVGEICQLVRLGVGEQRHVWIVPLTLWISQKG